ncbi:DUF6069 family protein [Williamsia sterculiae]|uniref:DUF6069 family protein n=1 Tax=Williamsia sterculiae TaxID=1344003 RepID=UPI00389AAF82
MYSDDPRDRDPRTARYERDPYGHPDDRYGYPGGGQYYQQPAYDQDPRYAPPPQQAPQKPPRRGPQINAGLYAGGVIASAIVTALAAWLVAWVIRIISERITEMGKLGVWNPMAQDEYWFAVVAVLCALAGGALWYLLQLTTPSPNQFYTWIVGLLIAAAVVVPLALSSEIWVGISTAVEHVVIGVPILVLIRAVGAKSIVGRR